MPPPIITDVHLDHPLDADTELELIRAAVGAGYQVFASKETDDLEIGFETSSAADLGVSEVCREKGLLKWLLIDGVEITYIHIPHGWLRPRRETWDEYGDYRVRFGSLSEIEARNERERRNQDTERRHELASKRRPSGNVVLRKLHLKVKQMKEAGFTQYEMCRRLGSDDRPPGVAWSRLAWPEAFASRKFGGGSEEVARRRSPHKSVCIVLDLRISYVS